MGGSLKVTTLYFLAEVHADMVSKAKNWPAALYLDKIGIDPVTLRVAIGLAEVFLSFMLLTPSATPAACALIFIMCGAIVTHVRLNEPVTAPAFMLCLLACLVVLRGMLKKNVQGMATVKSD